MHPKKHHPHFPGTEFIGSRKLRRLAILLAGIGRLTAADTCLLNDNFNSANYSAASFNSTLAADQSGTLAAVTYSTANNSQDWQIQHGNGGQMLLAGWNAGLSGDLYASLNHNFATEANSSNQPLKVQFDLKVSSAWDPSNWATVAIGSAQNAFVVNSANKFSSLFRLSGGTQQFASGADVSGSGFSWTPSGSTVTVVLSNTAGNGSPFNGSGSVAKIYLNGALTGTYTLAQMAATDGYVNFEANGAFANYDNLLVSLGNTSVLDYTVTYSGNGSNAGTVPVDAGNPYGSGSTVTVLGNTGGLTRAGYQFVNWNTAANGGGTSYTAGNTFNISSFTSLHAQWTPSPDVVWSNATGNRKWSSTDANWSGSLSWNNSNWDSAVFGATGVGAVTLTEAITARAITFNAAGYSLSGGSLTLTGPQTITCNADATISSSLDTSGLNKSGTGTLTLAGGSAYIGSVSVSAGTLRMNSALLDGCTAVSLASGTRMDLNFTGTNEILSLTLNGTSLPAGIYNAQHPVYGAYFTGTGSLGILPMRYQLAGGNENWPAGMRAEIVSYMNEAIASYNANGYFDMLCTANYSAGVPTSQASYGGWIDFGGYRTVTVAIHELAHCLGAGTYWAWGYQISNGQWVGAHTVQRIRQIDGAGGSIGADSAHFWPYGMNYAYEDSPVARVRHAKVVAAMRWDMGIVSDSDNDGLPDDWEMFCFGNLSQSGTGDSDQDGLNNLAEYAGDTNPTVKNLDFTWNNNAATGLWNTSDTNWSGLPWVNSASNNAFFTNVGGTITLSAPVTCGRVTIGNSGLNVPDITFSGGGITAASVTTQGYGMNGGGYSGNPTLTLSVPQASVTGDLAVGRANLVVTSGSVTAGRIISSPASADWGRLVVQGGAVNATNGVDGSVNTAATFQVELNGGTLALPSLRVANRDLNGIGPDGYGNDANLLWNGGTLKATGADNANFITVYGDGGNGTNPTQATYVLAGGAIIDTNGRNIGIQVKLLNGGGGGGLTKNGTGTLTLSAANTYAGGTSVTAGKLTITGSMTATTSATVAAGATLEVAGGTLAVSGNVTNSGTLVFSGASQFSATGTITNNGVIINSSPSMTLPANIVNNGTVYNVPSAPTGLSATSGSGQVSLSWSAVSGATGYNVKQATVSGGPYTVVAAPTGTTQVVSGLTAGATYYFVVSATNPAGESANSSVVSCVVGGLPLPWVTADIGAVGLMGSATAINGTYAVNGSGTGVYASTDQFRMVYQNSSGDCQLIARLDSLTAPSASAKAGVMIRESLAANARCAGVYVTPSSGVQFIWRTTAGSMPSIATATGLTAPRWVRIQRVGNSFRAYHSPNGTTWTQFGGSKTISMATSAYLGQAVTSGTNSSLCTGVFSGVTATP